MTRATVQEDMDFQSASAHAGTRNKKLRVAPTQTIRGRPKMSPGLCWNESVTMGAGSTIRLGLPPVRSAQLIPKGLGRVARQPADHNGKGIRGISQQ